MLLLISMLKWTAPCRRAPAHQTRKDGAPRWFRQANFKITAWAETLEEAV